MGQEERAPWDTGNINTIRVGGKEFVIIKKGADYANQTVSLIGWASRISTQAAARLREMGLSPEESSPIDLAVALLSIGLEQQFLFELGAIILGTDDVDFVRDNFDLGWIIDAMMRIWDNQPGIRWLARTIQKRFFSSTGERKERSGPSTSSDKPTVSRTGRSRSTRSDTETDGSSDPSA